MQRSLDSTLRALRQDLDTRLDPAAIERACHLAGHRWRDRHLGPVPLIRWLLVQVLHGNTALQHISLMADRSFTASALAHARTRLPLAVLQTLLKGMIEALTPTTTAPGGTWLGHRTLLIDGSTFSMPDTPELQKHFGQPGTQAVGCGFPVARLLTTFDAHTGLLLDVRAMPLRTHELSQVQATLDAFGPGDVLVGDRGYCSYAHLALLRARGAHAVLRVHQRQLVDFTPRRPHAQGKSKGQGSAGRPRSRWVGALGPEDQVVVWRRPEARPEWMSAEAFASLPAELMLRELRYTISRPGSRTRTVTLVTTLIDGSTYSGEALAELYRGRWRVEQDLRDLKQTLGMDQLKCRTVSGVLKELAAYAIVYNLVRLVMAEAASRQGVAPSRISFVDAMRWLMQARPGDDLPPLVVVPVRPDRVEPRVRKRRPKQFPLMTKPRDELRKGLIDKRLTA